MIMPCGRNLGVEFVEVYMSMGFWHEYLQREADGDFCCESLLCRCHEFDFRLFTFVDKTVDACVEF